MLVAEWLSGDRPESALTSDNSENTTYGAGVCQLGPGRPPDAYPRSHDHAYVHPAVVGRLTAAVLTYVHNGRRPGGRFCISLLGGPAGGRGGLDHKVER